MFTEVAEGSTVKECTVCCFPERHAVDQQLLAGVVSLRSIARQTGLSKTALIRHRDNHIAVAMVKAHEAEVASNAQSLLDQVRHIATECKRLQIASEQAGDTRAALQALQTMSRQVELLARLAVEVSRQRNAATAPKQIDGQLASRYTLEELLNAANGLRRAEGRPELVIDATPVTIPALPANLEGARFTE